MHCLNTSLGSGIKFSMTGITAGILNYVMQVGKIMGIMAVGTLHRGFVIYECLYI